MRLIVLFILSIFPAEFIVASNGENLPDTSNIDIVSDSTTVDTISDSIVVDTVSDSMVVDTVPDSMTIDTISDSMVVDTIPDSMTIDTVSDTADDTTNAETPTMVDTVLFRQGNQLGAYTLASDSTDFEKHLCQNPTKALFKSMVLPGWGQIGNHRYIKATIYAGLEVWLISSAIKYGGEANDFYEMYESDTTVAGRNSYYDSYMNRKDSRNKYRWFAVIVSFISMFDAYVDAHLSGFPDKKPFEKISLDVRSDTKGNVRAIVSVPF